ncbi:hypothetical protein KJ781_01325 [Patescibacteria group bacterium]|nr:hypothetical protein [Patescibacteria group bacterium]MBU1448859.1 hypothetical protein [Patescibacteria group bacterium]MBU2613647.1 hypothetical protein [Patescibacteria group bacterium]
MATNPLTHADPTKSSDEQLAEESRAYREDHKDTQFICWLLMILRSLKLPWWTPAQMREAFPSSMRMTAFAARPDIRQQITTILVGLPMNTARRMTPDLQATLLDQVVDNKDVPVENWENEFTPEELSVYMDITSFWHRFRTEMPWSKNIDAHQQLVCDVIEEFLKPRKSSTGKDLGVILTHHDVLSAIDRKVWQTHIPIEIRVEIDAALLAQEASKKSAPFHAKDILGIATPKIIADNIPLKDLIGIFDAAEKVMGFEKKKPETSAVEPDDKAVTVAPPPKEQPGAASDAEPISIQPESVPKPPPLPDIPTQDASPDTSEDADPAAASSEETLASTSDVDDADDCSVEIHIEDFGHKSSDSKTEEKKPPALPKVAAYISDDAFEKAGGASAGSDKNTPKDNQASASLNSNVFEIEDALGITLPVDLDLSNLVLADIKTLLVDMELIDDEERFREAIMGILPHLAPSKFPKDGDWKRHDFLKLRSSFFNALDEMDKGKPIRLSLISDLAKKGPPSRSKFLPSRK